MASSDPHAAQGRDDSATPSPGETIRSYILGVTGDRGASREAAVAALDALLAENERLRTESSAMTGLYYAVERADRHGNLDMDLEDAFGRCEAALAAARVEEAASNG